MRYLTASIMYWVAAVASASFAAPPLGGIGALPLMTEAISSLDPFFRRGPHTALSPSFGAVGIALWQPAHDCSYTALPSAAATGPTLHSTANDAIAINARFMTVILSSLKN